MSQFDQTASPGLNAVLDAAGAMMVCMELDGTVRTFNSAAERLLGWQAEEVVGRHRSTLWHDANEIAARAAELSQELGRKVSPGFAVLVANIGDHVNKQRQWTFVRKDGGRINVQLAISAIHDLTGSVTGYLGMADALPQPIDRTNHSNLEQRPKDTLHLRTIQRLADFCNLLTSESDDVFEFVVRILSQVMEVPVVCLSQVVGNELHFRALHQQARGCAATEAYHRKVPELYISATAH